jgi:TRAP-type C4-dicarboxylate transport system permease small subunit
MSGMRAVAMVLIFAGILGLVYGGVTYTSQTHHADIGPIELAFKEKSTVNIPIWAAIGAIVVGGGILFIRKSG